MEVLRSYLRRRSIFGGLCALGVLLVCLSLPQHPPGVLRPAWRLDGVQDATAFRAAAELLGTNGLYREEAVLNAQERNTGTRNAGRLFIRPPWFAFFVGWMAWIPYPAAIGLWKVLLLAGAVLFVALWPGDRRTAGLSLCWSVPMAAAFEQGQDTIWLLVLLAAALRLMHAGHEKWAGVCLALCTFKFHFLLLLPVFILDRRRRRVAEGAAVGLALLVLGSFAIQGHSWVADYFRLLSRPDLDTLPWIMPTLRGLQWPVAMRVLGTGVVIVSVWRVVRRWPAMVSLAACVAGAMLIVPHAYLQDSLLLVPFYLAALHWLPSWRWLAALSLSPLATYPLAAWLPLIGPALIVVPALLLLCALAWGEQVAV